ncbi:hypothetical protein Y032_0375g228 [Ancylostoma ceylanicum]|uniref:Uncharacterized protein n=1 Tax=Ancylostoma ceylanicum TaxID=53326 RepID=A0A016RUC5_9BILA|nr:hypothetical protein Y032_0375g228 [Ancylostoma ceylanicum]
MNHDASFAFVARTEDGAEILKWYVLCALEKDCMAPPGAQLQCTFKDGRYKNYANCHRNPPNELAINVNSICQRAWFWQVFLVCQL